jgi:hypothetical protein
MSSGKKKPMRVAIPRSPLIAVVTEGMRKGIDDVKRAAQDKTAGGARIVKLK